MKLGVKYFFLADIRVIWHLVKYSIFLQLHVRGCTGSYLGFMRLFVVSVGTVISLDPMVALPERDYLNSQ